MWLFNLTPRNGRSLLSWPNDTIDSNWVMFSNVSLTLIRSFKFSSLKNTYRMTTGTSTSAKGDLGGETDEFAL